MVKHLNKERYCLKLVSKAATKSCSIKKIFFFSRCSYSKHCLNCSGEKKAYSRRSLYFFPGHFIKNKNRFILTGIQVFWSRNKLRTGVLPRIFNHSTKYLNLQDHCVCFPISSLRISYHLSILTEYVILPVHLCFPQNKSFSQPTLHYPEHFRITGKSILQNTFFTE